MADKDVSKALTVMQARTLEAVRAIYEETGAPAEWRQIAKRVHGERFLTNTIASLITRRLIYVPTLGIAAYLPRGEASPGIAAALDASLKKASATADVAAPPESLSDAGRNAAVAALADMASSGWFSKMLGQARETHVGSAVPPGVLDEHMRRVAVYGTGTLRAPATGEAYWRERAERAETDAASLMGAVLSALAQLQLAVRFRDDCGEVERCVLGAAGELERTARGGASRWFSALQVKVGLGDVLAASVRAVLDEATAHGHAVMTRALADYQRGETPRPRTSNAVPDDAAVEAIYRAVALKPCAKDAVGTRHRDLEVISSFRHSTRPIEIPGAPRTGQDEQVRASLMAHDYGPWLSSHSACRSHGCPAFRTISTPGGVVRHHQSPSAVGTVAPGPCEAA